MKLFRYRKPSINTMLGITRAKKRVNKALGITDLMRPLRAPENFVRRVKRRSGYYTVKRVAKGQVPTPLGCFIPPVLLLLLAGALTLAR